MGTRARRRGVAPDRLDRAGIAKLLQPRLSEPREFCGARNRPKWVKSRQVRNRPRLEFSIVIY